MRAVLILTQVSLLALLGIIFTAFLFCTGPGRAVASMIQKSS
jgi:hypothetical protein